MVSNITEDVMPALTLEQFEQQSLPSVTPLIVYLSTISVTGAIGNILVIYIYLTQFERSNSKYFIICLAFTDLFSSIISHPFEIKIVVNEFTFKSDPTCKMSRFFNCVPTVASGFIFIAITTERYRKVCRPFGWQLTSRAAKYICVGCFVFSAIFSWPTLVLFGLNSYSVPELRENATTCSVNDSMKGTVYPFIFNSTLAFLFIFGSSFLVTMFTLIGRQLYYQFGKKCYNVELKGGSKMSQYTRRSTSEDRQNFKLRNEHDEHILTEQGCTEDLTPEEGHNHENELDTSDELVVLDPKDLKQKEDLTGEYNDHTSTEPEVNASSLPNECRKHTVRLQKLENQEKRSSRVVKKLNLFRKTSNLRGRGFSKSSGNDVDEVRMSRKVIRAHEKRTRRISFVMFLISLAFILSYLPHVVLMVTREIKKDFVSSMSPGQRSAYLFFLRSYALNSAVNPFIYSAFDKRFRIECQKTFRRFCSNRSCH